MIQKTQLIEKSSKLTKKTTYVVFTLYISIYTFYCSLHIFKENILMKHTLTIKYILIWYILIWLFIFRHMHVVSLNVTNHPKTCTKETRRAKSYQVVCGIHFFSVWNSVCVIRICNLRMGGSLTLSQAA